MGIFSHVLLSFCMLHLLVNDSTTVNLSRRPWTPANNRCSHLFLTLTFLNLLYTLFKVGLKCVMISRWSSLRRTRAVSKPAPINCNLGSWSSWTACDSCTESKVNLPQITQNSPEIFFTKM